MGASYGILYECDGCGLKVETWPKTSLGVHPSKYDNIPKGWKYVRCSDNKHRCEQPIKHLAYTLSCELCDLDSQNWNNERAKWQAARRDFGKGIAGFIRKMFVFNYVEKWEKENPCPGFCWPKAAARLEIK